MNNWVDLPAPESVQGLERRFQPLQWAKKHCPSYITNDGVIKDGVYHYRFYFGRERDQVMFALKWL